MLFLCNACVGYSENDKANDKRSKRTRKMEQTKNIHSHLSTLNTIEQLKHETKCSRRNINPPHGRKTGRCEIRRLKTLIAYRIL